MLRPFLFQHNVLLLHILTQICENFETSQNCAFKYKNTRLQMN